MQQTYRKIEQLKQILELENPTNIFLVTGKTSFEKSGAKEKIEPILKKYEITYFTDFTVNPKIEDVKKGIKLLKENNCDITIAIGGGSVIDIAKSINILANHEEDPERYVKKEIPLINPGKNFVAVPTTSGTGSEATHFAVLYINKKKYSLAHKEFLLPDHSILDHKLTFSLPKTTTATTGMDALSQAIESYWSVNSTEESRDYSEEAIKLIIKHLENVVNNPTEEAREAVMQAANLAGKAINITKTTAPHAFSYHITSHYGIPHGHAVALTLGPILVYNSNTTKEDCNDGRGDEHVKKIFQKLCDIFKKQNSQQINQYLTQLMLNIGLETDLEKLNIDPEEIEANVNFERLANNPRKFKPNVLKEILERK